MADLRKVYVLTEDDYCFGKIALELDGAYAICRADREAIPEGEILLFDLSSEKEPPRGAILLSRDPGEIAAGAIRLPFPIGALRDLLERGDRPAARLSLRKESRSAFLDGKEIRLSELEYSLLSLLIAAHGGWVSRARIASEVFSGDRSDGMINVYIHYLREKLERGGEKLILSGRKEGYRVPLSWTGAQQSTDEKEDDLCSR